MTKLLILSLAIVSVLGVFSVAKACDSDPAAFNYNAGIPDNVETCVPVIRGCMIKNAYNFNASANTPTNDTCRFHGGADPLLVSQPLWGMNGYDIEKNFITLKLGEKITYKLPIYHGSVFKGLGKEFTDVCPSWFPSPVLGKSACWTTLKR